MLLINIRQRFRTVGEKCSSYTKRFCLFHRCSHACRLKFMNVIWIRAIFIDIYCSDAKMSKACRVITTSCAHANNNHVHLYTQNHSICKRKLLIQVLKIHKAKYFGNKLEDINYVLFPIKQNYKMDHALKFCCYYFLH